MKLKLDENLDERLVDRIARAGHDVSSVRRQGLGGAKDDALFRACREEGRTFVTLDLDFSSVLRFPPEGTEGIVVLRLRSPLIRATRDLVDSLIALLKERSPRDQLWIIEPGRVVGSDPYIMLGSVSRRRSPGPVNSSRRNEWKTESPSIRL